eukprot:4241254-Amphidinium_carterae.1
MLKKTLKSWFWGLWWDLAVKRYALHWAGPTARRDREVVLAAVTHVWDALLWAGENCRDDREIVLAA